MRRLVWVDTLGLHKLVRRNIFRFYGTVPFMEANIQFRRKVSSLINLCCLSRLILNNTQGICAFGKRRLMNVRKVSSSPPRLYYPLKKTPIKQKLNTIGNE